jgi:hypothetical protein
MVSIALTLAVLSCAFHQERFDHHFLASLLSLRAPVDPTVLLAQPDPRMTSLKCWNSGVESKDASFINLAHT